MEESRVKDDAKTKTQLINELIELRERIGELEASEIDHRPLEEEKS